MPEYLAPGVYVEETSFRSKPIEGVSTSTAGMAGPSPRGPQSPTLVSSWSEYQRVFGAAEDHAGTFLPYAARGFFDNGGRRLYVARVSRADAEAAELRLPTDTAGQDLIVTASSRGDFSNRLWVTIQPVADSRIDVSIEVENGSTSDADEDFSGLSVVPGDADYFVDRINSESLYVQLVWESDDLPPATPAPANTAALSGGSDGTEPFLAATFVGETGSETRAATGLAGLAEVTDLSLITIPDAVNENLITSAAERHRLADAQVKHCEDLRYRFAILNVPAGSSDARAIRPNIDSSRAAVYFPWLSVSAFDGSSTVLVPPGGHIAGIYARTDIQRGVHKAPANEVVSGVASPALEFDISNRDQELFNELRVNAIRQFSGRGVRVWGARTLSSDPEWKYVNVSRLMLYLEHSIDVGIQWAVFEPNNAKLWENVRRSIEAFLHIQWRNGLLQGEKPEKAYFVRCDRSTMTQNDLDNGRLVCQIGIAPLRPAEFVIFRISQLTVDTR